MASLVSEMVSTDRPSHKVVQILGAQFPRVGVFQLEGTRARLSGGRGIPDDGIGAEISLVDRTPLRSAIEAASPIIGSGRESGGLALANAIGIGPARTFVIVPIVEGGRVTALAYADRIDQPVSLSQTAELFAYCRAQLSPGGESRPRTIRSSRRMRSVARRTQTFQRRQSAPALEPATAPKLAPPPPPPEALELPTVVEEEAPAPPSPQADQGFIEAEAAVDVPAAGERSGWDDKPESPLESALSLASATAAALPEWSRGSGESAATVLPPPDTVVITPDGAFESLPEPVFTAEHRKWIVGGAALAAAVLIAMILTVVFALAPPHGSGNAVVRIPRGAAVPEIAQRLAAADVIRSPFGFRLVAKLSGADRKIKSGTYRLPLNGFAWEIASELVRGQVDLTTVTVPEGLALDEVAEIIDASGLTSKRAFLAATQDRRLLDRHGISAVSAEGYLFPETYRIARGLSAREIVSILIEHFHEVRSSIPVARELEGTALHRWVTLASIVQREVRSSDEMDEVAGVFANRLLQDMRLESCATIQYILGETKTKLTLDDVRIPHPYNTYLNEGLPPGPIASPGQEALAASAAPAEHDYLFFVAKEDGSGTHVFSKTFAAHERAKKRAQR
ncbi:MAG: endolytic transglycosylase MltG [Myxococcota bacterium]